MRGLYQCWSEYAECELALEVLQFEVGSLRWCGQNT